MSVTRTCQLQTSVSQLHTQSTGQKSRQAEYIVLELVREKCDLNGFHRCPITAHETNAIHVSPTVARDQQLPDPRNRSQLPGTNYKEIRIYLGLISNK